MRVGIFGGSFDPVHFGHLWMAELSREAMQLDEVLFVPTATSPLKPHGPVASNEQRVAMLQLALSGYSPMRIDTREIDRGGTSFTIDTVQSLRRERPEDEFFLLVGSDAFRSIDRWKQPQELLSIVTPVVLSRGGDLQMDWELVEALAGSSRASEIRAAAIRLPLIEVSSAELRTRIGERRSIRFRVPRPVEAYIEAEKIYQPRG